MAKTKIKSVKRLLRDFPGEIDDVEEVHELERKTEIYTVAEGGFVSSVTDFIVAERGPKNMVNLRVWSEMVITPDEEKFDEISESLEKYYDKSKCVVDSDDDVIRVSCLAEGTLDLKEIPRKRWMKELVREVRHLRDESNKDVRESEEFF